MKKLPSHLLTLLLLLLAGLCAQAGSALAGSSASPAPGDDPVYLPLVLKQSGGMVRATPTPSPSHLPPTSTPLPPTETPPPSPAPTATPVTRRAWSVFGLSSPVQENSLPALSVSGATWVRPSRMVRWSEVEPIEGQRNWEVLESLEAELSAAAERGFWTILTVGSTPDWARLVPGSGSHCGPVKLDKLPAFTDFVGDLVKRYSQPPYQVRYWLLWDEVDSPRSSTPAEAPGCWGDPSVSGYGGGEYTAMLQASYPAIKQADPNATVIVGGLKLDCRDCPSTHFLEGVLLNGGGSSFDAVGFYAHDEFSVFDFGWGSTFQFSSPGWQVDWFHSGPSLLAKKGFLSEVLGNFGTGGKSYIGLGSSLLCDTCPLDDATYRQAKADYLAQLYASAAGMEAVIWEDLAGLAGADFIPQGSEDLPFYAYQFSRLEGPGSAEYLGSVQPGEVGGFTDIRGYKYSRPGDEIWVLWLVSTEAEFREVTFDQIPVIAQNIYGDPVNILPDVAIGVSPVSVTFSR